MPVHGDRSNPAEAERRLEALFRDDYPAVLRYVARRVPADSVDDVVADVFLVAWRRLDRVPEQSRPWLIAVARNVIATHVRGSRRREALNKRLRASDEDTFELVLEEPESLMGLALAQMSERDREAVLLVAVEELTPTEAAIALGEAPVTFRVRLHRAKRRLRRALEEVEESDTALWPSDLIRPKETTS